MPRESETQNRLLKLLTSKLPHTYLGSLQGRENGNVIVPLLEKYLRGRGCRVVGEGQSEGPPNESLISRAIDRLRNTADNPIGTLLDRNKAVYQLLRYGVPLKPAPGQPTETVHLIDWEAAVNNDFYLAEEVSLPGGKHNKRPDVVVYVNGIALAVLELKSGHVSLEDGIGQSIRNQEPDFIEGFFPTIQLVLAGNDSQGLRYGTIGTKRKWFLEWKENEEDASTYKLDKHLLQLLEPVRFIELMRDFVLFDGKIKKLPRPHQYFGIKAAQDYVKRHEGGIIWQDRKSVV